MGDGESADGWFDDLSWLDELGDEGPTKDEYGRFWDSPLGQSIRAGRRDPDKTFTKSYESNGVTIGVTLSDDLGGHRRGSLDELFERVADPSRPFSKQFEVTHCDLLDWLEGQNPSYRPTAIQKLVWWPAYRKRLRMMREGAIRGRDNATEPVAGRPQAVPAVGARITNQSIEKIEQETPALDLRSIEWVASRKKNQEKLCFPTTTLANYRLAANGGRQLSAYFGVDKDGRRWRRDPAKTKGSTVYYFAIDLKKYQPKVSKVIL